jgi:hypothetical protein
MGRLTLEERRRVFLIQQQARCEALARMSTPAAAAEPSAPPRSWLSQLAKTAMIVALLGGGWLVYHTVEFHAPASVVEALLPRR